jgi:magnesium-transporting ATPase (P-type)
LFQVPHRQEVFGSNRLPEPEAESWLSIFIGSFNDATLIVLIVSAIVSLVIGRIQGRAGRMLTWKTFLPLPPDALSFTSDQPGR